MSIWSFWVVLILLAILLIIGALLALREFRKDKKIGSLVVNYILLAVLTTIVLKLLFAVSAIPMPI